MADIDALIRSITVPPARDALTLDAMRARAAARRRRSAALALAVFVAIAIAGSAIAWDRGRDGSQQPVDVGPAPDASRAASVRWRSDGAAMDALAVTAGRGSVTSAHSIVLVSDGYGNPGNLVALDASTGEEQWRYAVATGSAEGHSTVLGVGDGITLIASDAGFVAALDLGDGSERWRRALTPDESPQAALIDGGTVFFGTSVTFEGAADPSVAYALDVMTGNDRWRTPFERGAELQWAPPTRAGGVVLWAVSPEIWAGGVEQLHAVDAATGARRWSTRLGGDSAAFHDRQPVTGDGAVVIESMRVGGSVVAVNLDDGSVRWRRDTGVYVRPRAFDGSHVWVTSADTAYALDPATGRVDRTVVGASVVTAGDAGLVTAGDSWVAVGSGPRSTLDLGAAYGAVDAGRTVVVTLQRGLALVDRGTGMVRTAAVPKGTEGMAIHVAVTPTCVAVLYADGTLVAYDLPR